jgi:putative oxidoreductase
LTNALKAFLGRYEPQTWALFRIVAAFLYACHGAQKLFGVLDGHTVYGKPLMVTAGVIEFGGGVLITLGLLTTPAAFIASGEMAVAYFKAHLPNGFWPILNRGELSALYCFAFLAIAARGAGIWSVDSKLRSARG